MTDTLWTDRVGVIFLYVKREEQYFININKLVQCYIVSQVQAKDSIFFKTFPITHATIIFPFWKIIASFSYQQMSKLLILQSNP